MQDKIPWVKGPSRRKVNAYLESLPARRREAAGAEEGRSRRSFGIGLGKVVSRVGASLLGDDEEEKREVPTVA